MTRKFFGTDGIRGVANVSPLDPASLIKLGKAIVRVFDARRGSHKILIGKDTRLSGYMIETALAAGITSMGGNVYLVGPLPTPGISYLTGSMRVDAGIMISASHNPFEDNGIKIFGRDGFKLPDEIEAQIEAEMLSEDLDTHTVGPQDIGKAKRIDDAVGRYAVYLKNCFPKDINIDNLKIGFDCANGAAYQVAPLVFEELGAEVVVRGNNPNGKNINAGFGSLYPQVVSELVQERKLNIGISLDGDADRAIIVDEKGKIYDGDMILGICAKFLKSEGKLLKNKVISTVMSNLALDKFLAEDGIQLEKVQVGDRYVLEKMKQDGLVLGGEQSGHTIFLDHANSGDGILTALKIVEVMLREKKPLSELAKDYKRFPQEIVNVKVSKKPEISSLEEVSSLIAETEEKLKDSGRVLVRYSGTENKARVMVECEDSKQCKKHANNIAGAIEKAIGAV